MHRQTSRTLIYTLFLLSGCAGLVYEVVWTRQLTLLFGGTTYAITTVLVAFLSGLALGSYVASKFADRLNRAGAVYGCLEIAVALSVLAVPALLAASQPLYRAVYPLASDAPWVLSTARFCTAFIVLLIPTTCMGATLPILIRYLTQRGDAFGKSVARLYGINTLGAALGVSLAGFWLIPTFGLTATTWIAAGVNLLVGVTALIFIRSAPVGADKRAASKSDVTQRRLMALTIPPGARKVAWLALAVSGFAAMVYEIAWTRALIMSVGSSTYAFTCILCAFILGLGLGSLLIGHWVDRWSRVVLAFALLEFGIALSAVLMISIHGRVPAIVARLVAEHHGNYGLLMKYEFLLIIAVTLVPTLLMGAVFPVATRILAADREGSGRTVGRAYAVNTLGTIAGAFLAGFVLIRSSVLGVQGSILLAAALNAGVAAWLIIASRPPGAALRSRLVGAGGVLVSVGVVAVVGGRWDRLQLTSAPYLHRPGALSQREVVYYGEGVDITVAVHRKTDTGILVLTVNGKPDASSDVADLPTQLLSGHLPALLTPGAKKACVVGLGSGMTVAALSRYANFERIDCAEISAEVIKAAAFFNPYTYNVLSDDPRVRLFRADGRNHLLLTDRRYDVIVSEPSNPWIAGVSSLFTREFFELCKNRLNKHGHLCAWVHSYSMSLRDFQMVVRTLGDVFENVSIWRAHQGDYLMIGGMDASAIPLDSVVRAFNAEAVRADLYRIGASNLGRVLGTFVASGEALRRWAADAPIHTDDNALLEFSAPRSVYSRNDLSISQALHQFQESPFDKMLAASPNGEQDIVVRDQAQRSIEARHHLLEGLVELENGSVEQGLSQLLEGYERDPGNLELYIALHQVRRAIEDQSSGGTVSGKLATMFRRIDGLRQPVIAPPTGAALADVVADLRSLANRAHKQSQWQLAADYGREANDLTPGNSRIVAMLAFDLGQSGRLDEGVRLLDNYLRNDPRNGFVNYSRGMMAVQQSDFDQAFLHLDRALQSGDIPVSALSKEIMLQPIRNDPRFESLLRQHSR